MIVAVQEFAPDSVACLTDRGPIFSRGEFFRVAVELNGMEVDSTSFEHLSMGGGHTLGIGIPHLDKFAYLGVFSSGVFGITGGPGGNDRQGPSFEERHAAVVDDERLKEGLQLVWFATGADDFLVETSRATVKMLEDHKFDVVYNETEGAHTWDKWREYLHEFAPRLFQTGAELKLSRNVADTATESVVAHRTDPVLTIEGGKVQGVPSETAGVTVYRGLPFAAAPVGDLRWKEPQPVTVGWDQNSGQFFGSCFTFAGTRSISFRDKRI